MKDYLIQFALLRERAFREPNDRDVFRKLLLYMELTGNHAEGRDLFLTILDEFPYCSYAWYNLGWACVQLELHDEALEAFEYAYITQPYFEEAYRACAELAVQRGLHRQALQYYTELNSHAEANSDVLARMAECYRLLGDLERARNFCFQALQLDARHADAHYQLASCCATESNHADAVKWLRGAIRYNNRKAEFHSSIALAYGYLGRPQKAQFHLWKAVELAPEEAAYWLQLAEFLLFAGDFQDAADVLEQALENSSSADLIYCRAACLFLSGQRHAAVQTLRQALRLDASRHPDFFRWAPALRDDLEIIGLLRGFHSS